MRLLLPLLGLLFSQCDLRPPDPVPAPLQVDGGTVERLSDFPSHFVAPRNVDVWLPEGYGDGTSYPVLYLHDGQMLYAASTTWNGQEWGIDETMGQLLRQASIRPAIIVGIWNSDATRHADYFPQRPFENLSPSYRESLLQKTKPGTDAPLFAAAVQSDRYLQFITEELKPTIDRQYATLPEREHTFIGGSSMGGLISMYALCEYPEVFSAAACLSTHWPGIFEVENNPIPDAFIAYLREQLPDPGTQRWYFDYGTATLDTLYEPFQVRVDEIFREKGYPTADWQSLKFAGADHSENAWRRRLAVPLQFLLGPQ